MKIYQSPYLIIEHFPENSLFIMTWQENTSEMTINDFKQESLNCLDLTYKLRPQKMMVDSREMFFPVVPELQDWLNENVLRANLELGLNISAFVMSLEEITQMSIEQAMDEQEGVKFQNAFFDTREAAFDWITAISVPA
jgi:hypothetical protein